MAALGTVVLLSSDSLLTFSSYSVVSGRALNQSVQLLAQDNAPFLLTNYALAGTVSNSYHPPMVGQLWPRGDLDAN